MKSTTAIKFYDSTDNVFMILDSNLFFFIQFISVLLYYYCYYFFQ